MSWNYRICKDKDGNHQIHEVYYDDDGTINLWTLNAIAPTGETKDELLENLVQMMVASGQPVVDLVKEEKRLKST